MGALAKKREELYTYGDYLKWDDGERWELIDGVPQIWCWFSGKKSFQFQDLSELNVR